MMPLCRSSGPPQLTPIAFRSPRLSAISRIAAHIFSSACCGPDSGRVGNSIRESTCGGLSAEMIAVFVPPISTPTNMYFLLQIAQRNSMVETAALLLQSVYFGDACCVNSKRLDLERMKVAAPLCLDKTEIKQRVRCPSGR